MNLSLGYSESDGLCSAGPVAGGVALSPAGCPALVPGDVARLAASSGAEFLCVRPSARSFSRWVCCPLFGSQSAAGEFAKAAARKFGLPFCAVRSVGSRFSVSVPCLVTEFLDCPGAVPCLYCSLSGS